MEAPVHLPGFQSVRLHETMKAPVLGVILIHFRLLPLGSISWLITHAASDCRRVGQRKACGL
jgi:hypothetical protein